jgi:hypothetical protein
MLLVTWMFCSRPPGLFPGMLSRRLRLSKSGKRGSGSSEPAGSPEALQEALVALLQWLQACGVPVLVIGGMAVSMLGRPRMTRDLDAVATIPDQEWAKFLETGKQFQIEPRLKDPENQPSPGSHPQRGKKIPHKKLVQVCLEHAQTSRVFLLRHVPTDTPIDLSVGGSEFEQQALARCQLLERRGVVVPLPQVEDLLIFKAIANRPVDQVDIIELIKRHPQFDLEYVRRWLQGFDASLGDTDFEMEFLQLIETIRRKSAK